MKKDSRLDTQPSKEVLPTLSTTSQIAFSNQPAIKSPADLELDRLATSDPMVSEIAKDILSQLKYSFVAVASGQAVGSGNEFAKLHRDFIATMKPTAKAAYAQAASRLLAAPLVTRQGHFGRYASIAPNNFLTLNGAALMRSAGPLTVNADARNLGNLARVQSSNASAINVQQDPATTETGIQQKVAESSAAKLKQKNERSKDLADGHKFKKVEFFIDEVRCRVAAADPIGAPANEIALGGVAIGATGVTRQIKQFMVKEGFTANSGSNVKKYKNGKHFAGYNIVIDGPGPHSYFVTMAMAEIDWGGFAGFLEGLWSQIKELVVDAISEIPVFGPVIGWLLGEFIGWLISLAEDDPLGISSRQLILNHSSKSYYDKAGLTSSKGIPVTLKFLQGGDYRVKGGWRLMHP
jgi:hypothetical protein